MMVRNMELLRRADEILKCGVSMGGLLSVRNVELVRGTGEILKS